MIPLHTAPRDWIGETCILVASGPSTERVDLSLIRGLRTIAVAHGYRAVPHADVLVVGGVAFYRNNDLRDFHGGLIVAAQEGGKIDATDPRLVRMIRGGPLGLSDDPRELCGSESSVMLAVNYAVHRGIRRIVLLGCDGRPSDDGRRRVGVRERDTRNARDRYQQQEAAMASQLEPLAELGIRIVNASPGTAMTIYPTATMEDALC
jgi:hypothetical protein